MTSWKVGMESLRVRDALLHGWGRVQGTGAAPQRAWLDIRGANGEMQGTIPCILGKLSRSGDRAHIDFVLYGPLRTLSDDSAFALVLEWDNGVQSRLNVGQPDKIVTRKGLAALLALPWKHYCFRVLQLIRYGEIGPLFRKLNRMVQVLIATGRDPAGLLDLAQRTGKPLALVIDHDLGGGANVFRQIYVKRLEAEGYLPMLVTAQHGILAYQLVLTLRGRQRLAYERDLATLFAMLSAVKFDRVVFNNIVSFPDPCGFVEVLSDMLQKDSAAKFIFMLHDYYGVCPAWLLLDHEGRYCGVPDAATCGACLPRNPAQFLHLSTTLDIAVWREKWAGLLRRADEVRCFSAESKKILLKAYPGLDHERVTLVPHTLEHLHLRTVNVKDRGAPVVGIIGNIGHAKGSAVIQGLAQHIKASGSPVRLVVIGTSDLELDARVVTVTGPYRPDQLPDLIESNGINIGFFPSIWPETFSYVTQEMMEMGLPVLTFALGAPMERVAAYRRGLVIPLGGPEEILTGIHALYQSHVH